MSSGNTIRIKCPNFSCQRVLDVPAETRGKIVRCSYCRTNIRVPQPKTEQGEADKSAA